MNLNDHYALFYNTSLCFGAHHENSIYPYYQWQSVVHGLKFLRIKGLCGYSRFFGEGRYTTVGWSKTAIFSAIRFLELYTSIA